MKLLIIALLTLNVIAGIQAATLPLRQCEINQLILSHRGVCAAFSRDTCVDFCTGQVLATIEQCSAASECCWNEDKCVFKVIPTFEYENMNEDLSTDKTILRRSKRQARGGGVDGSIESDGSGTTFSGRVNQDVGKNGNVFLGGKYHHPSNAWQVNGGYEHTLPNNDRFSISGNTDSYGSRGARVEYSKKFQGGSFGVNAGVQSSPWGGTSPSFGFRFSKRWRR